jgi:hypothetical protein
MEPIQDYDAYKRYKRYLLVEDIKAKAIEMGIDLEGKDINLIADRVQHGIDNNDGLWEHYWLSISYTLEDI